MYTITVFKYISQKLAIYPPGAIIGANRSANYIRNHGVTLLSKNPISIHKF